MLTSKEYAQRGLYYPQFEHDACGMGFVADISGKKSHQILKDALEILVHMTHRGAVGADPLTGDGAGVMTQIPHDFFEKELKNLKIDLPAAGEYGVGMLFLPKAKKDSVKKFLDILEKNCKKADLEILGYRDVPVNGTILGIGSKNSEPDIKQVFLRLKNADHAKLGM